MTTRFEGWRVARWLTGGAFAACAVALAATGWSEEGLRRVVRLSARFSVTCFSLAFAASSLHAAWRSGATAWLLRNRRAFGVSFAAIHYLHLAALAALALWFPEPLVSELDAVTLVGGGIAYAFILAMALTSNDAAQAKLGTRRWRLLHRIGGYYLWVLFAQSYVPRAIEDPGYVPAATLLIAALGLRVYAGVRKRSR